MTAIGFFLAALGIVVVLLFGVPHGEWCVTRRTNNWDAFGGLLFTGGVVVLAVQLLIWMWRNLP